MKSDEFLPDLKAHFQKWRKQKRYRREPIPEGLLTKARAAALKYGAKRVARALKIERKRIESAGSPVVTPEITETPSFSRIQVTFPRGPQSPQPLMEVETLAGVKLRVFAMTPETVSVLSSFCRGGGAA